MISFKVGIMGTGKIASTVANTVNKIPGFEVYAVASRTAEKAAKFAEEHGITKSYGSYEEMVNDPEIELVYIATPHSEHYENAKLSINAGKNTLVEKPFTHNLVTTKEVLELAESKKVYCAEAMWVRYMPMYLRMLQEIRNDIIGTPRMLTANLGHHLRFSERIVKPEYAGGALLDLGVYPITLGMMIFGDPESVTSSCNKLETGVDAIDLIQANYSDGRKATFMASVAFASDNRGVIYGTKGRIEIDNILNPSEIRFYNYNGEIITQYNPPKSMITGYEYEFISARESIIRRELQPLEVTHQDTFTVMKICDMLRQSWDVYYPLPGEEELKASKKN